MFRLSLLSVPLLLSGTALAVPVAAQTFAAPSRTDADRLADAVRRVGASPRDLSALVEAGELSIKVGDATAAAAFFKRAEQVDPNNGRVKAGIARILVAGEHPGEALRYFDQAARTGLSMAPYAGDRGLAYDLTGEQERAQRDYRQALKQADDDEIRRRYALSLGIAGRRDEALKEIDALLRRSDRGAWRARAFILAMNGDVAGANKIATSMMPGMASGLSAFFQRLPTLPAADRAFAVHFGEVSTSPARLADARLAPPLAPLGVDPDAPRQVAAVVPAAPVQVARNDATGRRDRNDDRRATTRRERRERDNGRRPGAPSGYLAPVVTGRSVVGGGVAPVATAALTRPATTTSVASTPTPTPAATPTPTPTPTPTSTPTATTSAPVQVASAPRVPPVAASPVPSSLPSPIGSSVGGPVPAPAPLSAPVVAAVSRPATPAAATAIPGVVPAVTATPPVRTAAASAPPAAVIRATTRPANVAAPAPPRGDADEILARIVANIKVPASELTAPAAPARAAAGTSSAATLDRAARRAERNVAAQRGAKDTATRTAAIEEAPAPAKPTAAERRAKAAADRKAKEEAAEKKALADKAAAEKKAAKAEPARYWVQVAGGANQRDLSRAWSDVQKKAPALSGKSAYTTPLRATNRVVTGPFKTESEARAMVNTLAKQGVSAFTFASDAGQKMTRLGGK